MAGGCDRAGISSWYVPNTVEERSGGAATASFGPGPDIQVTGRVAVWEPPRRVVFVGGAGVGGLAFEWMVETREDATCLVRFINTGFGADAEHDVQYDGMTEGWRLFMLNLQLHLQHFAGQTATVVLPMAMWTGPREAAWEALASGLGSGSSRHPPDYRRTPPVQHRRAVVDGGEDWLHRTADSGRAVAGGG